MLEKFHSNEIVNIDNLEKDEIESKENVLKNINKSKQNSISESVNGSMNRNKSEGPFQCINCKTNFWHADELIIHKRVHIGERIFSCKYCDKIFNQMDLHRNHEETHTEENPFSLFIKKNSQKR